MAFMFLPLQPPALLPFLEIEVEEPMGGRPMSKRNVRLPGRTGGEAPKGVRLQAQLGFSLPQVQPHSGVHTQAKVISMLFPTGGHVVFTSYLYHPLVFILALF